VASSSIETITEKRPGINKRLNAKAQDLLNPK